MSEHPGEGQGESYSMKALNTMIEPYQSQKGDGLPWLVLPWYREPNEIAENGTASSSQDQRNYLLLHRRVDLKQHSELVNLSHWIRTHGCICHPSARSKEIGVTCIHMEQKIPKCKEEHHSENTDDGVIDTNIPWLGF